MKTSFDSIKLQQ